MMAASDPEASAPAPPEGGVVVYTTRITKLQNTLVSVLGALLGRSSKGGIVLSIDRPHTYIRRLLEKQGVPQERLSYLDAVSCISGETAPSGEGAAALGSPFCVDLLSDFRSACTSLLEEGDPGFILVDNLGALSPYASEGCIGRFLEGLVAIGRSRQGFACIFVMDKEHQRALFEAVLRLNAREVAA